MHDEQSPIVGGDIITSMLNATKEVIEEELNRSKLGIAIQQGES
jgi:hypothetical protein